MTTRVWVLNTHEELLKRFCSSEFSDYSSFDAKRDIRTGNVPSGLFSKLAREFVLGKVDFWENEGSKRRVPFVRIDNHLAYPNGVVMTPYDWIDVRYHRGRKTIDQKTPLSRVQLLSAPNNDFIRKVFVTYNLDAIISKPRQRERQFIVYCDESHLYKGRVK